jgi:hypothetical protein
MEAASTAPPKKEERRGHATNPRQMTRSYSYAFKSNLAFRIVRSAAVSV